MDKKGNVFTKTAKYDIIVILKYKGRKKNNLTNS